MNTQTQEAGYLFDFSKFLFDEHGLIVTDTEMQEIIHQAKKVATQPIAAEGKSAGVWVKASERMPELYPVNNSHEFHYRLDGYKVDGFFLHSQCFEYFNPEIAGYTQLELTEFNRIEWLDEYASQPKGAGVEPDIKNSCDDNKPLTVCQAGRDTECYHPKCPVTAEDVKNGKYCTLPLNDWRE